MLQKSIDNLDLLLLTYFLCYLHTKKKEALESVMCDVIKRRIKRRDTTRVKIK